MRGHNFIGVIIIIIGLSILFSFPFFNIIFALILLWVGVRIVSGRSWSGGPWKQATGIIKEDFLRRVLVFSSLQSKLKTESFEGMEIVAIFGGGELDASAISTKKTNVDINLVTIFGGIKLKLPKGWTVKNEGAGILGGFDNNTTPSSKSSVIVHLKGVAMFGGVEVEN